MRLFKFKNIIFIIIAIFFVHFCVTFPYFLFSNYENDIFLTAQEFESIKNNNNLFYQNKILTVSNENNNDEIIKEYVVKYKLFNLINIKTLKLKVAEKEEYFAGGNCLGFTLYSEGAMVIGGNYILTKHGREYPLKDSDLKIGDIIIKINDKSVKSIADITTGLKDYNGKEKLNLLVRRGKEELNIEIMPALDMYSQSYKLGTWLKDTAVGVGTLTYINNSTNRFGALGHAVTAGENRNGYKVRDGDLYNCVVVGVKASSSGEAGQLLGAFSQSQPSLGRIDKNCEYGVFGNITKPASFIKNKKPMKIGGRTVAKPGRAKILSCVDGVNIEEYDIEIIKTNFQKNSSEKSMVIRIIDKNLIQKTGGIVQGMSGSPIIQNGNLVGAVTHVFLSDATKGFGLYIDWMINE